MNGTEKAIRAVILAHLRKLVARMVAELATQTGDRLGSYGSEADAELVKGGQ